MHLLPNAYGVYHYPTINVTLQMHSLWNIAQRVDVGLHVWIYGRL